MPNGSQQRTSPHETLFSEASAVRRSGDTRFTVDLDSRWSVTGKLHGGYLVAVMARAATAVVAERTGHPHVLAASTHFCRPPRADRAAVGVQVLHQGRSATRVRAWMSQDDELCADTVFTFGRLGAPDGADQARHWDGGAPQRSTVAYEQAVAFRPPADVLRVELFDHLQLRLDPESLGSLASGHPSGKGELRGWLALPAEEPFDPISLQLAVDAMPPATFDIEVTGWVPTLQLTTYTRALPGAGPVQVLHRAHLVHGDRVDESCHVWDSDGRLVAQSVQLAGIRMTPPTTD